MLKPVKIPVAEIYVPAGQRKAFDEGKLEQRAEEYLSDHDSPPIQVRKGKGRYVLVKGLHRLEAAKALGEELVEAILVQAQRH